MIPREHVIAGLKVGIEILGSRLHATLITEPIFNASRTRLHC